MSRDRLVLYVQLTLGSAHMARVRALDAQPGLACLGVQVASREQTRRYQLDPQSESEVVTLLDGVYETIPLHRRWRAVRRLIRERRPFAVVIDAPADPVQFELARYARGQGAAAWTRWASTRDDYARRAPREWLKGVVYRRFDGYVATGVRSVEYLSSFGVPRDRIHACGNPVDAAAIEAARARRVGGARQTRFLFAGRFIPHKNLERFVRAYGRYRDSGGTWGLDLVGFGETEESVRRAAASIPDVRFHGHLDFPELVEMYLDGGALVLPSISENWGLVVNEAMHAGMPVLVTRSCGCFPELVREGENGFGMNARSDDSMVEALRRMASLPEAERERFGGTSLRIIETQSLSSWAGRLRSALLGPGAAEGTAS